MNRAFPHWHAALFAAFAMTVHYAGMNVNFGLFQRHQLRNSQSCSIHQLEHGAISYSFFGRYIRRCKQAIDFLFGEKLWQVRKLLRRVEIFSRVMLDMTVEHQEAKETTRRADGSRHG